MRLPLQRKVRDRLDAWSHRLPRPLAVALDLIPADPEEAGLIRGAQVRAIVRMTPLVMLASCVNATVVLATFSVMGRLHPGYWIWALLLFAMALNFMGAWQARRKGTRRSASRRTIRRLILNGALFGALWGVIPAVAFPGAPFEIKLFLACVVAGMMSAGGFVLATVPLAGTAYVVLISAGALVALLQERSPVYLGIVTLLVSYTAVVIANIHWSASLFVGSLLSEMQVRKEVAAREQAQAQSAHAERMTALGELAGGIAHDFNNILQVVSGGAARIERHSADTIDVARQARQIQDAVERGSAISRRLLAFARRDALSAEPIDAAAVFAELGELLTHMIGPTIRVHVDVTMAPGRFLADPGRLETVILNLATNARDAMLDEGDLTVSAASVVLDQDCEAPRLAAGRYVRIAVADTGTGMDAATLARAAEPFFTTKAKGRGTGLGLSMAKGFAEQSGGAFEIASDLGRGTTVTLWLPQADAGSAHRAAPLAKSGNGVKAGLGRRILVVDDDDLVRDALVSFFQDAGYVTLGADNGNSAIALLDRGAAVDALVTDLSMPGMSGIDLIHEVHARTPGLPAILLTGHVGDVATQAARTMADENLVLLQKPMRPAQIAERLVRMMVKEP